MDNGWPLSSLVCAASHRLPARQHGRTDHSVEVDHHVLDHQEVDQQEVNGQEVDGGKPKMFLMRQTQ